MKKYNFVISSCKQRKTIWKAKARLSSRSIEEVLRIWPHAKSQKQQNIVEMQPRLSIS